MTPDDQDVETPDLGGPRLVHFKVETCASIDPKGIAEYLFGTQKHLVVLHSGKHENPHWHFQGYLKVDYKDMQKCLDKMKAGHSKKIAKPGSRPVKQARENVSYRGFQYMMKEESPRVVCCSGFSDEDLLQLHEDSQEHCEKLKGELFHVFTEQLPLDEQLAPKLLHNKARVAGFRHYWANEKLPPPNFQRLVVHHMFKAARAAVGDTITARPWLEKLEEYCASNI